MTGALRMTSHENGPRMATRMLASAIFMSRQREGLAVALGRPKGGRVRDLPGHPFSDENCDQLCVNPRAGKIGLLGRQFIETGQALHAFEGKLDLPPQAIDRE